MKTRIQEILEEDRKTTEFFQYHNFKRRWNVRHWSDTQMVTFNMTPKEAANKAGVTVVVGFERLYLDGVPTKRADWREILGAKLMTRGYKPVRQ